MQRSLVFFKDYFLLSSGGINIFLIRRLSSSGFSSLVSAIGHARLFVYREVRAGSSAGYPVGHFVTICTWGELNPESKATRGWALG